MRINYWKIILTILIIVLAFPSSLSFKPSSHGAVSSKLNTVDSIEGDITITKYQDSNGKLKFASDKGYASIKRIHNDAGQIIAEYYYDESGNPAEQSAGQYGLSRKYNEAGQNYIVTYLNIEGIPMLNNVGYATAVRTFNDKNQVIQEVYYGIDGEIIRLSEGQYGTAYEYDSDGHQVKVTFLDQNGEKFTNKSGYTSLYRSFNAEGSIDTEYFLDINDNPVKVNDAYGIKHVGKYRFYVDENGKVIISISNIVKNFPWVIILFGLILAVIAVFVPGRWKAVFIALYVVAIIGQTLLNRETGGRLELTPFWSYKQFFSNYSLRLEILNNIWLFVPFGAGLYSLLHKGHSVKEDKDSKQIVDNKGTKDLKKRGIYKFQFLHTPWLPILTAMVFSIIIEASQYFFFLGLCEVDDVISNTLGAAIGVMIASSLLEINECVHKRKNFEASMGTRRIISSI